MPRLFFLPAILAILLSAGCGDPSTEPFRTWETYGGDPLSTRYSSLDQISTGNVNRLEVAWTYRSGDAEPDRTQLQVNPIIVDSLLFGTTPNVKAIALHAGTGEEIWRFDPFADTDRRQRANRGVVYWEEDDDRRILFTADDTLYALSALTGKPVASFGDNGRVSLKDGLGRDVSDARVTATSPGIVYRNLLILGSSVSEGVGSAPGDIRAYDVRSGEIAWTFHTIPRPGEFGYETWPEGAWRSHGGANAWAGLSLDPVRGVVFAPTGSAAPDFYGAHREGINLFANSVLALDAETGERIWHFQTVHHDLWDRDLPAPPNLVTVTHDGRRIDAVAQVTKSGYVFLLDRESGEPLFPVEERQVFSSDVPGEWAWSTQPHPTRPEAFVRQAFTEEEATNISQEANAFVLDSLRKVRYGHMWIPPSLQGTIIFPGFDGGAEWGGAAFDPQSGILYVNANEMPWTQRLVPLESEEGASQEPVSGADIYAQHCETCHGATLEGVQDMPGLEDIGERMSADAIHDQIRLGSDRMPGFAHLSETERDALVAFLLGEAETVPRPADKHHEVRDADTTLQFTHTGYHRFYDQEGYPAVRPPWGTLNAIDLNAGEILWQVPLGEFEELTERGIPPTGTENYGGPVVTAGGLVFIAASKDEKFRAFDKQTGRILWETDLPYGGYATPATYELDGKQYVVVAAGGGKMGTPSGDVYISFALPDSLTP